MNFQITPDRCHCSFGDGLVYEFIPSVNELFDNTCWHCAFWTRRGLPPVHDKCLVVPCQKAFRCDKNDGFWRISMSVDYQQFTKMLQTGG